MQLVPHLGWTVLGEGREVLVPDSSVAAEVGLIFFQPCPDIFWGNKRLGSSVNLTPLADFALLRLNPATGEGISKRRLRRQR